MDPHRSEMDESGCCLRAPQQEVWVLTPWWAGVVPTEPGPGTESVAAPPPRLARSFAWPAAFILCLPSRSAGSPRKHTEEAGMVSVSLEQSWEKPLGTRRARHSC